MTPIDPEHFLEELKTNLGSEDSIKAEILLSCFGSLDERNQTRALAEMVERRTPFSLGLIDQVLELAENSQLEGPLPFLMMLLDGETDPDLIAKTIRTLGAIGNPRAVNALSEYLYSGEAELLKAAIDALAAIKDPAATKRLSERFGASNDVDLLLLDAFASIQDPLALSKLNEALRSHHASIRNRAKSHLTRLGFQAVPLLVSNLISEDPDFLIHTLNILGEIGEVGAVRPIRKLLRSEPLDANVRFAAYEALGLIPLAKGSFVLAEGLSDPVPHVCLAAARAIERNHSDLLMKGVKNLLGDPSSAPRIVAAFLDSQCDRTFESLIVSESFRKLAFSHLRKAAHPETRRHFGHLLRSKGHSSWAEEVDKGISQTVSSNCLSIVAVDDSRMILGIYKSALYQLGHEAELFEFPASALERIREKKPDLLITDLNMPGLTGIELARAVRALYQGLPILMVTTQNDIDDRAEAHTAGVDAILLKPFTKEELGRKIDELMEGRK